MDEYLREIVDDELDSISGDPEILDDMSESEVEFDERGPVSKEPSDFMKRVYNRLLDEFPDYDSPNGPKKVLGWTIAKRRCVRENVKKFRDDRLMRCAIAATSKSLYNVNAKGTDPKPEFGTREQLFKDVPWSSALGIFVHNYF